MKQKEYTEGLEAREGFEKAMKTIFKAPKTKKGKPQDKPVTSTRKRKSSGKG